MRLLKRFAFPLAGLLLAAHLVLLGLFPIKSGDTWWHLKQGELYVATHSLPDQDPFAFTTAGRQWVHYSWMADILFYLIYLAAGLHGLVLFRLIMLVTIALLLYRLLRACKLHPFACILAVFVASLALRFRLFVRPEIFTFVLLIAVLGVLLDLQTGPPRRAYLLWFLQVLWTNVHASFVFGLGLPALVLFANLAPNRWMAPGWGRLQLSRPHLRHLAICVMGLPVASLLNPHGISLLLFPFRQNRMVRLTDFAEWMGVWALPSMGPGWWEVFLALGVVTLAFVAAAVLLLVREGRVDPVGWAIVLSMGTYALFRNRAVPFFVLAILPFVALALVRLAVHKRPRAPEESGARLQGMAVGGCLLVLVASLLYQGLLVERFPVGVGVHPNYFPEAAGAFLERHHLDGRVFNTYYFGGYLTWRRWPANQIFIDGRYDGILFDEALYEAYVEAQTDAAALDRLTAGFNIDLLVIGAMQGMNHLNQHPGWARVYWDQIAEVFVRRGSRFDHWIAAHEYRLTRFRLDTNYLQAYRRDPEKWHQAMAELRRAVEDNPENSWAWLGLAQEYGAAESAARQLDALDHALALFRTRANLGQLHAERAHALLKLGRLEEAAEAATRSLDLQRDLILPRAVLASVAERQGAWSRVRELMLDIQGHLQPGDPRAQSVRDNLRRLEERLRSEGLR